MIRLQVSFKHFAFFLPRKFMEHFSKILTKLPIEHLPTTFGYPNDMVLAFPFRVA
jgi:hypothetical protein